MMIMPPPHGLLIPWRRSEIRRTCPAISPVAGGELLADPGLEATYTAGLCTSLAQTLTGTPTESADAHGGSKAQQFVASAEYADLNVSLSGLSVGTWYQAITWGKTAVDAGGVWQSMYFQIDSTVILAGKPGATYTQSLGVIRATATTGFLIGFRQTHASLFDTAITDDWSVKPLTLSSCLTYLGTRPRLQGTYTCKPTLTASTQAGLAIGYLNINNFALMYHDGTNAKLDKRVAGTWTSVISAAAAYSASAELKVIVAANGTDFSLYYNGSAVGVTTAITDTLGKSVYGWSTYASNSVGLVTTSRAVA